MDSRVILTHNVKLYDLLASSVPKMHTLDRSARLEDVVDDDWEDDELATLDLTNLSLLGTKEGVPFKRADGVVYITPWGLSTCLHISRDR